MEEKRQKEGLGIEGLEGIKGKERKEGIKGIERKEGI